MTIKFLKKRERNLFGVKEGEKAKRAVKELTGRARVEKRREKESQQPKFQQNMDNTITPNLL